MKPSPNFDEAWKEQLARVRRWHMKTKRINRDRASVSDDELDVLFAFFQNCWHLYDWLKNSNALSVQTLDDFFREEETMKLCYDICIGTKHLRIAYPKASFNALAIAREYMGDDREEGKSQLILFRGGWRAMTLLADECMSLVESFLHRNYLSGN
jgi:hypothetical protein